MPVVVADTGPLNYLVQIGAIHVLPTLFDKVIVPAAVFDELIIMRDERATLGAGPDRQRAAMHQPRVPDENVTALAEELLRLAIALPNLVLEERGEQLGKRTESAQAV